MHSTGHHPGISSRYAQAHGPCSFCHRGSCSRELHLMRLAMTLNCRSWVLQQYDEAKKGPAVAAVPCSPPSKPRAAATQAKPAERKGDDDDWDLCGWQDEPSVVSMGRVSSQRQKSATHTCVTCGACVSHSRGFSDTKRQGLHTCCCMSLAAMLNSPDVNTPMFVSCAVSCSTCSVCQAGTAPGSPFTSAGAQPPAHTSCRHQARRQRRTQQTHGSCHGSCKQPEQAPNQGKACVSTAAAAAWQAVFAFKNSDSTRVFPNITMCRLSRRAQQRHSRAAGRASSHSFLQAGGYS